MYTVYIIPRLKTGRQIYMYMEERGQGETLGENSLGADSPNSLQNAIYSSLYGFSEHFIDRVNVCNINFIWKNMFSK